MLVLFETPAGYALFKVKDESKLKSVDNIFEEFKTPGKAQKFVELQSFHKFSTTTDALASATALSESKVDKTLKRFLRKEIVKAKVKDQVGVIDSKLAKSIKDKLDISVTSENVVNELTRGIRAQLQNLLPDVPTTDYNHMVLGLSHSLSRYKIKFSPDKVDTMIVQAIGLLDDLDKELNTYSMRVKEWYGWHFPELAKIIGDNALYAKTVKAIGIRKSTLPDLSDILPEELESQVADALKISMGTEISEDDILNITELCNQVLEMGEYREQLYEYLKNRMQAIAPNLTALVGELVGARLISHAGSLLNLAKHPASTVQILGAEKALFRALKTKHSTPKYGLIYHASLIGQASQKNKGKMSRVLANKCALSIRVDALGDKDTEMIGPSNRVTVENRLALLEGREVNKFSAKQSPGPKKYDSTRDASNPAFVREGKAYNPASDTTIPDSMIVDEEVPAKSSKKRKRDSEAAVEETPKKKKKTSKEESTPKKSKKEESTPKKSKKSKEESTPKKKSKDKKEKKKDKKKSKD